MKVVDERGEGGVLLAAHLQAPRMAALVPNALELTQVPWRTAFACSLQSDPQLERGGSDKHRKEALR